MSADGGRNLQNSMQNNLISVGELIDQSWTLYRAQFRAFMSLSGWLLIVAILNIIALILYPTVGALSLHSSLSHSEITGVLLYIFANFVVSPLLGLGIFIAMTQAADNTIEKRSFTFKQILLGTKNRYGSALIVTVLAACMIILAQIITIGPGILFVTLGLWINNAVILALADILMMLGAVASLILTIRWIMYYFMAPYANVLDGTQKKDALVRSRTLISGRFWRALLRVVLPKFVFFLFGLFFVTFISLLIQLLVNGSTGLSIDTSVRIGSLANSILPLLITILINPLMILSDVLLYKNLKGDRT